MGFYNEMSVATGDLSALEDAVAETENEIRDYGHASAGPAIRHCWRFFDNVRRNLARFAGLLPDEEDVQIRMAEIRERISALG